MSFVARGPLADSEELRSRLEAEASAGQTVGELTSFEGRRGYLKASLLRGKAHLRHSLRAALLRRSYPRVAEYENLAWLRANGFRAPRPLAAGVLRRANPSPYQFLLTEELVGAEPLHRALSAAGRAERREVLARLGREVARLHGLGFVHRDLYPRNLLLAQGGEGRALYFIDAWRGGARPQLRGPDYDQACLMLHGAAWFDPGEQAAYFRGYLEGQGTERAPTELRRWLARIAVERARLAARFGRARRPGSELPPAGEWDTEALLSELTAGQVSRC